MCWDKSCGCCYCPKCKSVWWWLHAELHITYYAISPCSITSQRLTCTVSCTPRTGTCFVHVLHDTFIIKYNFLLNLLTTAHLFTVKTHTAANSHSQSLIAVWYSREFTKCQVSSSGLPRWSGTAGWMNRVAKDCNWFLAEVTLLHLHRCFHCVPVVIQASRGTETVLHASNIFAEKCSELWMELIHSA